MASKKDMRRADLIVPYAEPAKDKNENDMSSTMASTLPMAAIFTRNKMIGWVAVVFAIQSWLAETPEQKRTASTPAYLQVGMSGMLRTPPPARPTSSRMSIENLKSHDPFAEADEDSGQIKQSQQDYIHIRIQQRNGRKTLTTVQGLPKKFDQKKILKVIKKKFACNGTVVADNEMGDVIQLQGDQRKDVQDFMTDKKEGLGLDAKTIKVSQNFLNFSRAD
ncbi:SUI1-domain-containing protein [Cucurbitaria berberidis CBS 394.84]|uniref:SUI1-domain-containing protein n=1 Tax=Cucurbitaria berberidis CBS 394.84 TaxID=1168544 RepID=A0A9P4L4Z4_9PLEO|nr:SUI1-domain-containing protein [Cucurbitaria berberidis CBS 394.84]KAF1841448.1 SUI1-domain-containing protein [Cucurbitaria berberidis CBS 394.84]